MENKIKPLNFDEKVRPEFKEEFAKFSHSFKDFQEDKFPARRKEMNDQIKEFPKYHSENILVETRNIPGPENAPEIRIKIYKPKDRSSDKLPGVLWIHGGGQLFGSADFTAYWGPLLVEKVDCIVVAVDYRLAPEHPYPAGIEDCYAALVWMSKEPEELGGIDGSRIAVAGESAGGNLTAALCLLARDRKGPKICLQMPLCPMLDDRNQTHSSYEITDERVWNREVNLAAWKMYLKDYEGKETPIYAAPSRAKDLSNLPPVYTFIGELDLFRDETIEYVQRLMQAGVPVDFHIYSGCFHVFEMLFPDLEFTKRVFNMSINALKRVLHPMVKIESK